MLKVAAAFVLAVVASEGHTLAQVEEMAAEAGLFAAMAAAAAVLAAILVLAVMAALALARLLALAALAVAVFEAALVEVLGFMAKAATALPGQLHRLANITGMLVAAACGAPCMLERAVATVAAQEATAVLPSRVLERCELFGPAIPGPSHQPVFINPNFQEQT